MGRNVSEVTSVEGGGRRQMCAFCLVYFSSWHIFSNETKTRLKQSVHNAALEGPVIFGRR